MKRLFTYFCLSVISLSLSAFVAKSAQVSKNGSKSKWSIERQDNTFVIQAGNLKRLIKLEKANISTISFQIGVHEILDKSYPEISFAMSRSKLNKKPDLISEFEETKATESTATFGSTDNLIINGTESTLQNGPQWTQPLMLNSLNWDNRFDKITPIISYPQKGVTRLTLRVRAIHADSLKDVTASLVYEIYEGHSAIRQWVEMVNNSPIWYPS